MSNSDMNVDQWWFWADEWQTLEDEVDEDLRNGQYEDFDTMEDFLDSLDE